MNRTTVQDYSRDDRGGGGGGGGCKERQVKQSSPLLLTLKEVFATAISNPSFSAFSRAWSSVMPTKETSGCVKQAAGTARWFTMCSRPQQFSTTLMPCEREKTHHNRGKPVWRQTRPSGALSLHPREPHPNPKALSKSTLAPLPHDIKTLHSHDPHPNPKSPPVHPQPQTHSTSTHPSPLLTPSDSPSDILH